MKIFQVLIIAFCTLFFQNVYAAHQLYADMDGINIPYGTKLELSMAQDITTAMVNQGDMFEAYLTKNLYVNQKLIFPAKTLFRGRIFEVKQSKRFSKAATLYITLDHLVTKRGTQITLNSGIPTNFGYTLKNDNGLTSGGNYFTALKRDYKKAGSIVPRTAKWGATSGDNLFIGAKYVFIPVATVGGCVACISSSLYNTFADMIRKGDEVVIKKDTKFDVILLSTLEIPN